MTPQHDTIYDLLLKRNARETDPFVTVYSEVELLRSKNTHLENECRDQQRDISKVCVCSYSEIFLNKKEIILTLA